MKQQSRESTDLRQHFFSESYNSVRKKKHEFSFGHVHVYANRPPNVVRIIPMLYSSMLSMAKATFDVENQEIRKPLERLRPDDQPCPWPKIQRGFQFTQFSPNPFRHLTSCLLKSQKRLREAISGYSSIEMPHTSPNTSQIVGCSYYLERLGKYLNVQEITHT